MNEKEFGQEVRRGGRELSPSSLEVVIQHYVKDARRTDRQDVTAAIQLAGRIDELVSSL